MQAEDGKQEIYVEWPYGNFCKVCKMEKYKKNKNQGNFNKILLTHISEWLIQIWNVASGVWRLTPQ